MEDLAIKAVGIGSVGTRCFVGLFFSAENHPLLLQFKEACPSVLEPYAGKSRYDQAIGEFAVAYADQNAKDHAALVAAVKAGRIKALVEENS